MNIGRFYGGIAAVVWHPATARYLLLQRSPRKDYGAGVWECVTGRADQGEGLEEALRREVREELGVEVRVDFILGTTHFYRGAVMPKNELLGVVYGCSLDEPGAIRISAEHSDYRWVTAQGAAELLVARDPSTRWMRRVIERAEAVRRLLPPELLRYYQESGFELD